MSTGIEWPAPKVPYIMGFVRLDPMVGEVCEQLNVAPIVATQVVAHAERRGLELFIAPRRHPEADKGVRQRAADLMHAAYVSWIDRRQAA